MIYAYMRASNGDVDLKNQRKKLEACEFVKGKDIEFISDTVSSGKPYEQRKIASVVDGLKAGDVLLVAELSRMARNTEEVLKIGRLCVDKGASLKILNPVIDFDGGMQSEILLTVLGMASNIERYYIKSRTSIALARKKQEIAEKGYFTTKDGKRIRQLGTVKGSKKKLKLEDRKDEIFILLDKGLTQSSIAKLLDVSRHTISRFLTRFPREAVQAEEA
ncbi:MAG: helix-turn-helix domain-containing protein [Candidatus Thioglobus sp.]|nr:MAG: helix-turn-helix domain-containing protein [Candidatus Thioglobus sp.]